MKNTLTLCVPHAKLWGSHLHMDFAREVLPVVAVIIIVCMGDISLVKMLPWKKSVFYTESKGFPSISLMQLCLGVKTLQSAVSVICQISYLVSNSNLNDPTTSPQAKALFGLNIAVSMTSVIMGMIMLLLKGSLMRSVKGKDTESSNKEIEMSNDIVYTDNPLLKEIPDTDEKEFCFCITNSSKLNWEDEGSLVVFSAHSVITERTKDTLTTRLKP